MNQSPSLQGACPSIGHMWPARQGPLHPQPFHYQGANVSAPAVLRAKMATGSSLPLGEQDLRLPSAAAPRSPTGLLTRQGLSQGLPAASQIPSWNQPERSKPCLASLHRPWIWGDWSCCQAIVQMRSRWHGWAEQGWKLAGMTQKALESRVFFQLLGDAGSRQRMCSQQGLLPRFPCGRTAWCHSGCLGSAHSPGEDGLECGAASPPRA